MLKRARWGSPPNGFVKWILTEDQLRRIVIKAEECTRSEDQSNFARWYIDAHTYLEDGDYDSSVVKSWLIIEQHINSMWRSHLGRKRDPSYRNPRDKKSILNALLKAGRLTSDEFARLDGLRDRRNKVIHLGSTAAHKEASAFLVLAEELTRSLLNIPKSTS